jgi:Uma2 family endonuclease
MVYAPPKRKLTVEEYHRMGEDGILRADERVELLDGELYEMPPIGDGHVGGVNRLNVRFVLRVGERAIVSVQNPIRLSDFSEPEPDVALLRPRSDFYGTGKARPEDVLLLIEVADSSLEYDRQSKLPRYAASGIVEVWIVDVAGGVVEVYREPAGNEYAVRTVHRRGEILSPSALPDVTITVDEIVG